MLNFLACLPILLLFLFILCKLSRRFVEPITSFFWLWFTIFLSFLYSYEVAPRSDSEDESGSEYEEEVCVFVKKYCDNTVKNNTYISFSPSS